jgi:hypothetical protein
MWFQSVSESIFIVWKVSGDHEHPLEDVEEVTDWLTDWLIDWLIDQVIFSSLFNLSSGWCSMSVWERTNLRLQDTKPILSSNVYEGLPLITHLHLVPRLRMHGMVLS